MTCQTREFDLNATAMTCRQTCNTLWGIYMDVLAGSRARVRFGTRWSEYHVGNAELIREAYMSVYSGCQDTHGLPNLAKGHQMRRGPPGVVPNSGTFDRERQHARGPVGGAW